MEELWKDIEGYEGLYQISTLGRVKRVTTGRILKGGKNTSGYIQISLYKQGVRDVKRIHRLVAESFIPNTENKPEVNHINEDKTNNRVDNLTWSTRKENINHGTRNERVSKAKSIPIVAINIITGESKEFYGTNICGRQLELNPSSITKVLTGRLKQTGGYTFKYKAENQ